MALKAVRYFAQTKKDITSLEEVHLCVTEKNFFPCWISTWPRIICQNPDGLFSTYAILIDSDKNPMRKGIDVS